MLKGSNDQELEGQRFFFVFISEPLTSQPLNLYITETQKDLVIFSNLTLSSTFFCFKELDENVLGQMLVMLTIFLLNQDTENPGHV